MSKVLVGRKKWADVDGRWKGLRDTVGPPPETLVHYPDSIGQIPPAVLQK